MSTINTQAIYREISQLSNNEKIIILSKLLLEISTCIKKEPKLNIYDMKGIGKKIWEGIDAQEYVNQERASWE